MAPGRAAPTLGQHPDGAEVVLGFDGSFLGDCTALVAVTVADPPHVHLVKLWEAPEGSREWRVPLVEVEHAIRAACARWRVLEVAADPTAGNARWSCWTPRASRSASSRVTCPDGPGDRPVLLRRRRPAAEP
jgi:hypothetical protein